jgi:prepilin-type processing-associated H-X9-DG protein
LRPVGLDWTVDDAGRKPSAYSDSSAGTQSIYFLSTIATIPEPFSFHPSGCNTVFMDGSVRFLTDDIDCRVLRYMITRAEGIPLTQTGTGRMPYLPPKT